MDYSIHEFQIVILNYDNKKDGAKHILAAGNSSINLIVKRYTESVMASALTSKHVFQLQSCFVHHNKKMQTPILFFWGGEV